MTLVFDLLLKIEFSSKNVTFENSNFGIVLDDGSSTSISAGMATFTGEAKIRKTRLKTRF